MKKIFFLLSLIAFLTPGYAQIKTPAASPTARLSQDVGLAKIDLEYSRPSIKGRKIFGELVPFDQLWRTGANASTKVTFSDDVKVGNVPLTKGMYALYTIPGQKEWTIIFYKNTSFWGAPEPKEFKDEDVAARFLVPVQPLYDAVETFTMGFNNLRNSSADLEIMWEKTKVVVPVILDTDAKVMASIKAQMEGPSADSYYSSGRYYYEEKKDLNQALEWVNKAMEKGGEKYWMLRTKALILADLNRPKDAIAAAERSTELAKADGNNDYVRMNEKSIMEWKKK